MTEGPYPNHLAYFMAAKGLTDPALATKLEISKQQIFNLRHGHRKLTVEWAKRLAPHLGVSWERLITGTAAPADQARADLLTAFEALDERDRETVLRVAQSLARGDPPAVPPTQPKGADPPVRPFRVGGRAEENPVSGKCAATNVRHLPPARVPA
jgi:plasmid maintenance system antidote protein VapI